MRLAGLVQDGIGVHPKHQGIGNSEFGNQAEPMDAGKGVGGNLQLDPDTKERSLVFTSSFGIAVSLRRDRRTSRTRP